ncbi:NAD(P)/FAD-dependent oxidoreductase [Pseudonocardiaceae bacterium YIM PH 21723]|nr:NAD(P)/FAD-dependent oxidoreductase [Pseudonocardiaceae bacterium YIM PH 21723]
MRACVIGAGLSGLTTGKALTDRGVDYTCFESGDRIGGNWAFGNSNGHSSAYRSLHIDTSKYRLAFEDLPMPDHFPDFPHHSQVKEYLDLYAEKFGLLDRISFENPVKRAVRTPDGRWSVSTGDGETNEFDLLVVGNGHHWDPRFPEFPGEFTGELIHSHHYIDPFDPLDLRDKRILIVGIGNSAADIASELSQKSLKNQVTISTRSGAWIMPKYIFGMPVDRVHRTLPYVPVSVQRAILGAGFKLMFGTPERFGAPKPNHGFYTAHPTQSNDLLFRFSCGDLAAKPNIQRLDGDTVHFVDGTSGEFDTVIYATGYNISFPFFDEDFIAAPDNQLPLYKRIFKPGIDNLAFIGFAQGLPTLFPFIELQAKLLGAYAAGEYRLPSEAEMLRGIERDQRAHGSWKASARHTQQADYYLYRHDLRRELPAGRRRARKQPVGGKA